MKFIKGLVLVCFLAISISACFDPPEFKSTPEITFDKIQFKEVPGAGTNDSLILYIDFKDGDGDLGLDPDDETFAEPPFHSSDYFLTTPGCSTGQCDTTKVNTQIVYYGQENVPYVLLNSNGINGKLVTNKTRNQAGYIYLPAYSSSSCEFYSEDRLLVPEAAADASYNIIDTLEDQATKKKYFVIQEPLLYKKNTNHYNIEVKFLVFEGGNFVEFNWSKLCYEYDGRFPLLSSQSSALEGTIRYGMANPSYLALFSVKTLKLEVRIKDRALNVSNKVTTPQFTLDGIRVN
ncbi:MAG TPA: hypothetical protein VFU05_06870 [Cyclobacteriaceae bacterium]|nr:hypothetical protein [Cyclobacteriaceae bacterium]